MWTEAEHETPLGAVRVVMQGDVVCTLGFIDRWERLEAPWRRWYGPAPRQTAPAPALADALDGYFSGQLDALDRLLVAPRGTPFQRAVWEALRLIPAGGTTSYAALARSVDRPAAVRAVGAANGANPIWLLVPCHRAIGSDGTLTGYAGGVDRKRWLLAHEAQWATGAAAGRDQVPRSGDLFR